MTGAPYAWVSLQPATGSVSLQRLHSQGQSVAEAIRAIGVREVNIEIFYNRQRLHSAVDYRTPAEARASMEGIAMRAAA